MQQMSEKVSSHYLGRRYFLCCELFFDLRTSSLLICHFTLKELDIIHNFLSCHYELGLLTTIIYQYFEEANEISLTNKKRTDP